MGSIIEDAKDGATAVRDFGMTVKLVLTGIMLTGIGVSQAAFGWIGNGFVYRVLYPIPLILFGVGILWVTMTRAPAEAALERNDLDPMGEEDVDRSQA